MYIFESPSQIEKLYGPKIARCLLIRLDTTSDRRCIMVPVVAKDVEGTQEFFPVAMRLNVPMETLLPYNS